MFDLLRFKTKRNMQLLDRLFEVILDANQPFYAELWNAFASPYGEYAAQAYQEAIKNLGELHEIVKNYRRG